jgi:UDP-N-acetylmuramoylalanine--D-glutamate ligase
MGAIELLVRPGARVRAMDADSPAAESMARLNELGVPVMPQAAENIGGAEVIVLSPAVPWDLPMLVNARSRGISVIGEVELASYFLQGPVIGITGSNGKTTTTALSGHLLQECGIPCQVGGNIGRAPTAMVDSSRPEQWNVLELSSFQLESVEHFRARIGVCLNVTPDHLDRHHTFEIYSQAKRRLFETQTAGDFAVLNYDDQTCRSYGEITAATVFWFSSSRPVPSGMWLDRTNLLFNGQPTMQRNQIRLRGLHNVENVMAASLAAHLAGGEWTAIAQAVGTFAGVEHRIEFVRDVHGVQYFNDSKATNVDATLKAVEAFTEPLWIILGGKDKGASYEPLVAPLQKKARAALLIGAEPPYPYAASPLIANTFEGAVPVIQCGTLQAAVGYANQHAHAGDIVLLAPACASFDQFQSYEHRGAEFKHFVQLL